MCSILACYDPEGACDSRQICRPPTQSSTHVILFYFIFCPKRTDPQHDCGERFESERLERGGAFARRQGPRPCAFNRRGSPISTRHCHPVFFLSPTPSHIIKPPSRSAHHSVTPSSSHHAIILLHDHIIPRCHDDTITSHHHSIRSHRPVTP